MTAYLRIVVLSAAAIVPGAAAAEAWHYVIGEARLDQQANVCATRDDALEIAGIFRRFGVRPGYAVLSSAPGCRLAVHDLVPLELLAEVVVGEGEPGEHRLRFVEVRLGTGAIAVLVTTRELRAAP